MKQPQDYWKIPQAELVAVLETRQEGLSEDEAARRMATVGPNELVGRVKRHFLLEVSHRLKNPLVLILLIASLISISIGDVVDAVIIATIVIMSVLLDLVQEYHAHTAAERLKRSVALRCNVVRQGQAKEIPARELVPGDVVQVASGDLIPADGILLEAIDLFVNQAVLTGESYPQQKDQTSSKASRPEEATNALFMGTSVISGEGTLVVVSTGARTALGDIATSLQAVRPPTAFNQGVRRLGLLIMRIALFMVPLVVVINLALGRHWLTSLMFAVALGVGLTPELLPMIVSVALARGALRMAKDGMIVKRLAAIEDLGSLDILCTDKTGTLTEAQMRLERSVDPFGHESTQALELAFLNSTFQRGIRNPLDQAILSTTGIEVGGWTKLGEIPFDFERRRLSVLVQKAGQPRLITKGSAENLLPRCSHYQTSEGTIEALSEEVLRQISAMIDGYSSEGLRVIAVASKEMTQSQATREDEQMMILKGFLAFFDPPQESARAALEQLAKSGVSIKIITGDNQHVTQHLCQLLDLPITGILTGTEIDHLSDQALEVKAIEANLFCRVTPNQKRRIILSLKARGAAVGFLGDGVNDAPSLSTADVGLSAFTAVDAARDAADIILLQPNLTVVHGCVLEGRRTFANVMKYIMMATSSNFGNMMSMAVAVLVLPFLPMLPLQILLNNFLYDLSQIPIPMDRVQSVQLMRPQSWNIVSLRHFMFVAGPVSSVFDFLLFFILIFLFKASDVFFHTGWFVESIVTQVFVIFIIRTPLSIFRSRPHPLLFLSTVAVVAVAIGLPYSPLATWLGFVPLPLSFFAVLVGLVAVYFTCMEWVKRWYYRKYAPQLMGLVEPRD
jgi:P-type Mg2+ transporter